MKATKFFSVAVTLFGFLAPLSSAQQITPKSAGGNVRTYYVAADEVEWDYAPHGIDHMTGKPFEGYAKIHTERGPHRSGTKYLKAINREYTDVINIGPAQMITADMVPDKVGVWMYHCHVSDHVAAGMMTQYEVLP